MLHALMRRVNVVTDRGADTLHLVGGDRGADAGAAHHDAAVGRASRDLRRDLAGHVREVDRSVVIGPDILDLMAELAQVGHHRPLQGPAGMVRSDHETHGVIL